MAKTKEKDSMTPMMKQYFTLKAQCPEAVLLFRCGDFYETYGEDAVTASKVLGIVLTRRSSAMAEPIPMAGVPYHAIDVYLPKLIRAGYKVAICDQLEDPKLAKGIVKRGISEIITPGIAFGEQMLPQKENNFLAGLYFSSDNNCGAAFLDVSTGTFQVAQGSLDYIGTLLASFDPKEIVLPRGYEKPVRERYGTTAYISSIDEWAFVQDSAEEKLKAQLGVKSLKGFAIDRYPLGICAAGALLVYLEQTQHTGLRNICSISRIDGSKFVWMDKFTVRNLELFQPSTAEGKSLSDILDRTVTPMGSRTLKRWIAFPLKDIGEIEKRQSLTQRYFDDTEMTSGLTKRLALIGDLERVVSKVAVGRANPRALVQLKTALGAIEDIAALQPDLFEGADLCSDIKDLIDTYIVDEPPMAVGKGDVIRNGINPELDDYRNIAHNGKSYLMQIQQREIEATGISSLKINYNSVFGYYIEVRNMHKDKVPAEWIRKQTLVNAERYITQELKEYEEKILSAEDKMLALESEVVASVTAQAAAKTSELQRLAHIVANFDALCSLAIVAKERNYSKPQIDDSMILDIKDGRHPVIETQMPIGEEYVPNDVYLDNKSQQIIIITGPNMAGKSTYLRQTALIVLMAQIGSFVPATSAQIGVVDRIFTRVGASDNLLRGQSTFMVEMMETSAILKSATGKSLLIVDEIGRGTSTYDGLSLAWSILEYINLNLGARTLFATHYHELTDLNNIHKGIFNLNVGVNHDEKTGKMVFLHQINEGPASKSYGIEVARLAGLPSNVIDRAKEILFELEKSGDEEVNRVTLPVKKAEEKASGKKVEQRPVQLSLFAPANDELTEAVMAIDLLNTTPLNAMNILAHLKELANGR